MSLRKKRAQWIPVVTALMKRDGNVLLGQRPEGASLAGLWEFPGGKIELGENPEEALRRELFEELGIEAEIGELSLATSHTFGETGIVLLFYSVSFWKGELKSVHHSELRWVKISELDQYELPDANIKILAQLKKSLSQ